MDTWEQTAVLSGHRGLVLALACYGDRLISASDDRCIRVWRIGAWECERILTGHNGGVVGVCIVHGACGANAGPRRPRVLSLSLSLLRPLTPCAVCSLAGNLISASNDSFIKVWNSTGVQRPFTAK